MSRTRVHDPCPTPGAGFTPCALGVVDAIESTVAVAGHGPRALNRGYCVGGAVFKGMPTSAEGIDRAAGARNRTVTIKPRVT